MTPNNPTKDDCKIFAAAKLYLETNDPAYLSVTVAKPESTDGHGLRE